jgi:hypothetical protein
VTPQPTHAFDAVLKAAGRALDEVVAPSLDPANPLASEQLRLVLRFLDLVHQRAAHEALRLRAELALALQQAQALQPLVRAPWMPEEVGARVDLAVPAARTLLLDALADGCVLQRAAQQLDALVASAVRCAAEAPDSERRALERLVLASARRVLALRRAWFAPLGLDPEPATVPNIEQALNAALGGSRTTSLHGDTP